MCGTCDNGERNGMKCVDGEQIRFREEEKKFRVNCI